MDSAALYGNYTISTLSLAFVMTMPTSKIPADQLGRAIGDLRISVTDRCNFRCTYCMPAEVFGESYHFLPRQDILDFEEIERLARIFAGLGATKIRITGGEPLLRRDLNSLVSRLSNVEGIEDLSLTTNGFLLADMAAELARAGLNRITVSLDSLSPKTFSTMSGGISDPQIVLRAIDAAEAAGLSPIKINCVVQRGVNDAGIVDMASHFRGSGHILRFIEFMDVGTRNNWDLNNVVPRKEILELIDSHFPLEASAPNYNSEVARRYCYKDGSGEIGVIASVTNPFCRGCTRARLTTDGRLVTCLFAEDGIDLKTPLRAGADDSQISDIIAGRWRARVDRYSELRTNTTPGSRKPLEMYQVGG